MTARKILQEFVQAWLHYDEVGFKTRDEKFLASLATDAILYLHMAKREERAMAVDKKVITNADRIRVLSDGALAKEILRHRCVVCEDNGYCDVEELCEKEILDWLKMGADQSD